MAEPKGFARAGDVRTLVASFLYFDVSFMVWVSLGALGAFIAEDLQLSGTEKGLVTAVPILSGALLRVPLGLAADRWGGRRVGLAALAATSLPLSIGWAFGGSFPALVGVGILLGVAGASFAVAIPLASRSFPPEHQGLALGIAGAGNSGTVFATLLAPRLAEAFGWRSVFGIALIPVVAVFCAFLLLTRRSPGPARSASWASYREVLIEPDTFRFALFYALTFGGFVGLASFLPIFLREQFGLSKVTAGDLTAAMVLTGSLARPLGGLVADRMGGLRALPAMFCLVAVLFALLAQLPPLLLAAPVLLGLMAVLGSGNGVVFQLVPLRYPQQVGTVTGLVGAAGGIGGFFLPTVLGVIQEHAGTYGAGFAALAAFAALVFLAFVHGERGWSRSWGGTGSVARQGRRARRANIAGGGTP